VLLFTWTAKSAATISKRKWHLDDLAMAQRLVFSLLSSLMEGQLDRHVARRLASNYTKKVFDQATKFILSELARRRPDRFSHCELLAEKQYMYLLEGVCEMATMYLELWSTNSDSDQTNRSKIDELLKEVGKWPDSGLPKVSQIEYSSGTRVRRLYFPTPAIARALSVASMNKFHGRLDISSTEQVRALPPPAAELLSLALCAKQRSSHVNVCWSLC
jgi:hypothetical protein